MNRNVVLFRKKPAPTDEIYFLNPISPLVGSGRIDLKIYDSRHYFGRKTDILQSIQGSRVVVSRYIHPTWLTLLKDHHEKTDGITYIVDDDIPAARNTADLPGDYRRRMNLAAENEFSPMLDLADSIVVTSRYLYERYGSEKTFLLEPGLTTRFPESSVKSMPMEPLRIIYFATAMHQADLKLIAPSLIRVVERFDNVRIDIVISKIPQPELSSVPRIRFVKPMSWERYKRFFSKQQAHILLAPKLDTPYNLGKSFIKVLDAAACGAAGIYSNVRPYNEVVENGTDGLLVENHPEKWLEALSRLIENPSEIGRIAQKGRDLALRIGNPGRLTGFWEERLLRQ